MKEEQKIIFEKAFKLFQKYGIKSVTMDDVSKELGISKKTLYLHVKDKKELVQKIAELKITHAEKHNKEIQKGNLNAIDELLHVYKFLNVMLKDHNPSMMFDLRKYYPEIYERMQEARRNEIFNGIKNNLEKGRKEGFYRTDFDDEIISKLHVFRIENLVDSDLFTRADFESGKLFKELFTYHIRGIATNKGLTYFEKKSKELNL